MIVAAGIVTTDAEGSTDGVGSTEAGWQAVAHSNAMERTRMESLLIVGFRACRL
jgi:hypothetical protein